MKKITLNGEELKRIFEVTQCAVAKNESRPALQYAKVTLNGSSLTAVALDGYKMIRLTLKIEKQAEESFEFFIKPFPLPKDLYGAEIISAGNNLELELFCASGKQTHSIAQPAECFPMTERIIPKTDSNLSVSVDAKLLTSILKPFIKTDVYNSVNFSFCKIKEGIDKKQPILLTHNSEKESIEAIVLPLRKF